MVNGNKIGVYGIAQVEKEDYGEDYSDEIVLSLAEYNDLFSDFDLRHYSHRTLSDDFLIELKKASRDKEKKFSLQLLMPKSKRNVKDEGVIKKRLREHFKKHYEILRKEKNKVFWQGALFILFGILLMSIASYFVYYKEQYNFFMISLLVVILEPGSWFLFWEGLNLLLFESKKQSPDLQFYEKMNHSKINFGNNLNINGNKR